MDFRTTRTIHIVVSDTEKRLQNDDGHCGLESNRELGTTNLHCFPVSNRFVREKLTGSNERAFVLDLKSHYRFRLKMWAN